MAAAYSPHAIIPAQITLKENGTPVSEVFDDVYFSADDGFAESRYVFLEHNKLWQRWTQLTEQSLDNPFFVVAETGFGTGLNFLLTCLLFSQFKREYPQSALQLHYLSFEKHPIPTESLQQILDYFVEKEPDLAPFSQALICQYPSFIPGCHRLSFNNIQLDLHFGDIVECIEVLPSSSLGLVDAWYLDGFAPSKNAAMWSDSVLNKMGELAKPQATFSTFTAAGFVKRALQSAGFEVTKVKGFGRKREMLTGIWTATPQEHNRAYYQRQSGTALQQDITIIGGGLASAALLYELAKTPHLVGKVTLICADAELAQAASGNRQGGFYPLLHADYDPLTEFYSLAFDYAHREYSHILNSFDGEFCGTLALAHNADYLNRYQKVRDSALWPAHFAAWLSAEEASETANVELPFPSIYYPKGGWISPPSLAKALIAHAESKLSLQICLHQQVTEIQQHQAQWQLKVVDVKTHAEKQITAANLVFCTGANTPELTQQNQLTPLPIIPVRGQVSYPKASIQSQSLRSVLCFCGYMTPAFDGQHCIGSTFKKRDMNCDVREQEHQEIAQLMQHDFAQQSWADFVQEDKNPAGNAAIRATLADHLPVVGNIPDVAAYHVSYADLWKRFPHSSISPPDCQNAYVLSGLGARGLCSAPLAAAILASQLLNKPYPVSERVLNALAPNRFLIRQLRKPPKASKR